MTWFKIDDGFWSHPKTAALSGDAVALWVRAGAYSCQHLTDGYVPAHVLRLVGGDEKTAQELCNVGLWKTRKDGWKFHDWSEYQETSETVKTRREQQRERQRKRRTRRVGDTESHVAVTRDTPRECVTPDPTRPDPTNKDLSHLGIPTHDRAPENAESETTVPEILVAPTVPADDYPMIPIPYDWAPNDLHRAKHPRLDLPAEADAFRDHATSTGRLCHRRAGWDAAFSSWLRRAKPPEQPGKAAATTKAEGWLAIANAAGAQH